VLHNLHYAVWVCNTGEPEWYPGNDKCDIALVEHYADAGDNGVLAMKYKKREGVINGERVLALAEAGPIPEPTMQATGPTGWFGTTSSSRTASRTPSSSCRMSTRTLVL
jgi:mannan endo-1,4-beta-mannosidase